MKVRGKKKKLVGNKKRRPANPLRIDPTRTQTLRRRFQNDLKRRFARLRMEVIKLISEEDAFGLKPISHDPFHADDLRQPEKVIGWVPTRNVFCPTGAGGGVDPSCSPSERGSGLSVPKTEEEATKIAEDLREHLVESGSCALDGDCQTQAMLLVQRYPGAEVWSGSYEQNPEQHHLVVKLGEYFVDVTADQFPAGPAVKVFTEGDMEPGEFAEEYGGFRRTPAMEATFRRGLAANTRWRFSSNPEKVRAFSAWLKAQIQQRILGKDEETLWRQYVEEGFRKGAGRAFDDVNGTPKRKYRFGPAEGDFYRGSKEQFLRDSFAKPVAVEKVRLLADRTFTDLEGVTQQMSRAMTRTLTDGLVRGLGPREIARELADEVDELGSARALTVARTEIIRSHSEGQLEAMEMLGVEEVGVAVEWSIADENACSLCQDMNGVVLKLEEAHGLIPRHPNCIVGESVVEADDVLAVLKSHYTGEVVELVTAEGSRLTVTPNHILLTEHGFLPARFAYQGLKIVKASTFNLDVVKAPDDDSDKASIADIFAALTEHPMMASSRMPLSPEDLHGDGGSCNAEVYIVRPNCELGNKLNVHQEVVKGSLVFPRRFLKTSAGLEESLLVTSPKAQLLKRVAFAADRSMGRFREGLALLLGCLLHAQSHGLAAVSGLDSSVYQAFVNRTTAAPELFCQCLRAHPVLKQLDDLSVWQLKDLIDLETIDVLPNSDINAYGSQPAGNGILVGAEHLSKFSGRSTSVVEFDKAAVSCRATRSKRLSRASVLVGSKINSGTLQTRSDGALVHSEVTGDLFGGLPGLIEFDKVVDVKIKHVTDLPVYDLQTQSTLYCVNGLVTSNCRCAFLPANVGEDDAGQKDTKRQIDAAIRASLRDEDASPARAGEEGGAWGPGSPISKSRPRSILNTAQELPEELLAFSRWINRKAES